tara:strand:- start:177 stop:476 length:300 start_codon:yes stop_codon:yes gene_type:complete
MSDHELQLKESASGELFFRLPDQILDNLGWEEGDEVKFIEKDKGFLIKKVKYETIELDFDDEELLKYMKLAHEKRMSFNEWVEHALIQIINGELKLDLS